MDDILDDILPYNLHKSDVVFSFVFERAGLFLFLHDPDDIEVDSSVGSFREAHV